MDDEALGPPTVDDGPLHGLRVIDMSTLIAGPAAARYLADYGADVIKIEPPTGDTARSLGMHPAGDEDSYFWKLLGRNKRSVVVDLKTEPGRARFEGLVRQADVLV